MRKHAKTLGVHCERQLVYGGTAREAAIVKLAWQEWIATASYHGEIPEEACAAREPPRWFVAQELGFQAQDVSLLAALEKLRRSNRDAIRQLKRARDEDTGRVGLDCPYRVTYPDNELVDARPEEAQEVVAATWLPRDLNKHNRLDEARARVRAAAEERKRLREARRGRDVAILIEQAETDERAAKKLERLRRRGLT